MCFRLDRLDLLSAAPSVGFVLLWLGVSPPGAAPVCGSGFRSLRFLWAAFDRFGRQCVAVDSIGCFTTGWSGNCFFPADIPQVTAGKHACLACDAKLIGPRATLASKQESYPEKNIAGNEKRTWICFGPLDKCNFVTLVPSLMPLQALFDHIYILILIAWMILPTSSLSASSRS